MSERDSFFVQGGCWCPATWTLQKVRIEGHSEDCTRARRGWEANYRHLAAVGRQRREDEEAGRALREAGERPAHRH